MMKVLKPKKLLDGINKPLSIEVISPAEGHLVEQLRGEQSYRDFADYLNEGIPMGTPGRTTHGSVWNWETNVHPVGEVNLWAWQEFYPKKDLRHQLALAIKAVRRSAVSGQLFEENGHKLLEIVVEKVNGKQHKGVRS